MTPEAPHTQPKTLRSGFTTGACAAAAARGAALMLTHQVAVSEVTIELPAGISATFRLYGQHYSNDAASCFVIKDAGDDPDVTNGAEVQVTVRREQNAGSTLGDICISGGVGIGRVTKPGLAVPPGEWAINPVPRSMIEAAVSQVIFPTAASRSRKTDLFRVTVSIPDGEERARKTLNARLGIIGGLSILGTTGIVRPISAKAWTDTLDSALDVARACDCESVVLSTGRTSELAAQNYMKQKSRLAPLPTASLFDPPPGTPQLPEPGDFRQLPEEAYIMMGDHIAYALRACAQRGFMQPVISCQFAKLLKIACGHENTHAAASDIDLSRLLGWARDAGLPKAILDSITAANTAREIAITCCFDPALLELLFRHARLATAAHAPDISPHFLVADYNGNCVLNSR